MSAHPNTIASLIAGGLGTLTVYLLNRYADVSLTSVQAGAIATGYSGALLFVGRRGLKGTLIAVWNGVWNGTTPRQPVQPLSPPPEETP